MLTSIPTVLRVRTEPFSSPFFWGPRDKGIHFPQPDQPRAYFSLILITFSDEKLLFSKIPFRLWAKPLKLCIERRPKGTSQCAPRYRVTDSNEIPSDMVLLSIIPLDQLNTRLKFGILLRKITWIFIRNFPKTSDTRNISRKV
jgi:hypothetical protein